MTRGPYHHRARWGHHHVPQVDIVDIAGYEVADEAGIVLRLVDIDSGSPVVDSLDLVPS